MKAFSLFLPLFLVACHRQPESVPAAPAGPPLAVSLALVERRVIPLYEDVVGTVTPRLRAAVSAKMMGKVLEMKAIPGKAVAAGEVLAVLDAAELQAAADRARAASEQADRDLGRYRQMLASNAITKAEFDRVESVSTMAAAAMREAEAMLAQAQVVAPFEGVVTRKLAEEGDMARPGMPLFEVESPGTLRVEMNVGESLAGTLSLGQELPVVVEAVNVRVGGKVAEMAPSADVGSRTFLVKLDLPENESLHAGQFARVSVVHGETEAVVVPVEAVVSRGQMEMVWVAQDGKAVLRLVRTGRPVAGGVEILSGLQGGESLVLQPPADLREGRSLEETKPGS